jgi:hypothetical protein
MHSVSEDLQRSFGRIPAVSANVGVNLLLEQVERNGARVEHYIVKSSQ